MIKKIRGIKKVNFFKRELSAKSIFFIFIIFSFTREARKSPENTKVINIITWDGKYTRNIIHRKEDVKKVDPIRNLDIGLIAFLSAKIPERIKNIKNRHHRIAPINPCVITEVKINPKPLLNS